MMLPQTIPGCPPGLEYLAAIDRILCFQVGEGNVGGLGSITSITTPASASFEQTIVRPYVHKQVFVFRKYICWRRSLDGSRTTSTR